MPEVRGDWDQAVTSAVNLKFLSFLSTSSFRNFKFETALES
jgi:hypothetical protein